MMSKKLTPMDILFSKSNMRCTKCDASAGDCDCWEQCTCGWSFERGVDIGCANRECDHNRWKRNEQ